MHYACEVSFYYKNAVCVCVCVCVLVIQSCLTLCDSMDCSPPGSSVHRILQASILEWVAIPFSGKLPDSGTETGCPTFWGDFLPSRPPGKPQNAINYFNYNVHVTFKNLGEESQGHIRIWNDLGWNQLWRSGDN